MELMDSLTSLLIETDASLKGHHQRLCITRTVVGWDNRIGFDKKCRAG